jgi:hypothetical protein
VRSNLPRGLQAAQIVHAAGESIREPVDEGTHAIVLTVRDELALALLADRLHAGGVSFVRIHEPDPPYDGALMALGLVPGRKEVLRRYLSALPLLK